MKARQNETKRGLQRRWDKNKSCADHNQPKDKFDQLPAKEECADDAKGLPEQATSTEGFNDLI